MTRIAKPIMVGITISVLAYLIGWSIAWAAVQVANGDKPKQQVQIKSLEQVYYGR